MPVAELLRVTDVSAAACCSPLSKETITATDAEAVARTFKALGDPTRVRILSIVASHADQEACVCDLQEPLELSQPTVSHHLKILREAGLVESEGRGTWAYYRIVPEALSRLGEVFSTPNAIER